MGGNVNTVYDFLNGLAVFTGGTTTAGILLYFGVLVLILVFMRGAKSKFFFVALPITLIAGALGILRSDVMYLMLLLNIIGIVVQYKRLR